MSGIFNVYCDESCHLINGLIIVFTLELVLFSAASPAKPGPPQPLLAKEGLLRPPLQGGGAVGANLGCVAVSSP